MLKVVIKYFYPTSTLSSGHFKTVGSPQPSMTGVLSRKAQSASDRGGVLGLDHSVTVYVLLLELFKDFSDINIFWLEKANCYF